MYLYYYEKNDLSVFINAVDRQAQCAGSFLGQPLNYFILSGRYCKGAIYNLKTSLQTVDKLAGKESTNGVVLTRVAKRKGYVPARFGKPSVLAFFCQIYSIFLNIE